MRQIDGPSPSTPHSLDGISSLLERRLQLGLDADEVASCIGVGVKTYLAWEAHQVIPPERVRWSLAYVLDVGTRVIERWCGEPGPDDPYRIGRPRSSGWPGVEPSSGRVNPLG